jgi:2-haloacid dehalogenase
MSKPPPIQAVLFDAYGTLFDVHSVALKAEQLFPGKGMRLSQVWRDKQIEYTRLLTTSNNGAHYQPFWNVTENALQFAILLIAKESMNSLGYAEISSIKAVLMAEYRHLSAYPENREVLTALKARGIATGILSNGDRPMLEVAVKSAGLGDVLDHLISADQVKKYKTHPDVYALGPQTLGLKPTQIGFVSSNAWDALGATWYGFQTLWVNRSGAPLETLGTQPTHMGTSLRDVQRFFPA